MANLRIPERYKPGLFILASLPDASYEEFLLAASKAPNTFASNRELEAWLSTEVSSITSEKLSQLTDAVTSLYRLLAKSSIPKVSADVYDAAREGITNFKVADGVDFAGRISSLLALKSFNIVGLKAKELQGQCERSFCDSRIVTDLRPIFGDKVGEPPTAFIVVHTLKIGFHDSGSSEHKDLYVALDDQDITSLRKALERADDKAKSLKALTDAKGIKLIDLP